MEKKHKNKILVAMSGGVDSSAAAILLKNDGWDVMGATMRLFDPETDDRCKSCCSLRDALDASTAAKRMGIDFEILNMREEFKKYVIDKFVSEYEAGMTPNPCIDCNRHLKFDILMEKAEQMGCSAMATGHYARIDRRDPGSPKLCKAKNKEKDQSYVLYDIPVEMLKKLYFPLGEIVSKDETRMIAKDAGLQNHKKSESQDICFVPDGDYATAITRFSGKSYESGDFVDKAGKILGRHKGLIHYTIGQRRGLGIASTDGPLYVLDKDPKKNSVILGKDEELYQKDFDAVDVNWLVDDNHLNRLKNDDTIICAAKIRYHHEEQQCMIKMTGEHSVHVSFIEPQRAITPGQAAVFYDGDIVIGGGTIKML